MATTTIKPARKKKHDSSQPGPGGPWHTSTPRKVCEAYSSGDAEQGWQTWQRHLAQRKLALPAKLVGGKKSPLLWALPDELVGGPTARLLARMHQGLKASELQAAARQWLLEEDLASDPVEAGLECLSWAIALAQFADRLDESTWWSILNHLVATAQQARGPGDPLADQLLHAELPLTLAYLFGEVAACRDLAAPALAAINETLEAILDGEGLTHRDHLARARSLLACWTRCRALGTAFPEARWGVEASQQFGYLIQQALRLTRPDGRPMFAASGAAAWNEDLLKTALRLADDRVTKQVHRLATQGSAANGKDQPTAAIDGQWAGINLLRSNWQNASPRLAVRYESPQVDLELWLGKRCVLAGPWQADLTLDGKAVEPRGVWEQSCWESDSDVDYLELELRFNKGLTIQRHILLARQEQFLLLADAVLGADPDSALQYVGTLPTKDYSTLAPAEATREGELLCHGKPLARVLPLALKEWRSAPAVGQLQDSEPGLRLAQSVQGRALFAPLFIDLSTRRLSKEPTWRQLTVGQKRNIVAADAAVGYRVQVGKSQWLVYRSLTPPDTRTVLSKNLSGEFLVARFPANGQAETLLEIE